MLQAWDRDLPHMRNQCGVHRNFSKTRGTGNAAYCAKVRLRPPIPGSLKQHPLLWLRCRPACSTATLAPNL